MNTIARPGFRIAILLVFVTLSLGINFLHTESGPGVRGDCPACRFLTSSLSTSPGVVYAVPALLCQGTLPSVLPLRSNEIVVLSLSSRSPPST